MGQTKQLLKRFELPVRKGLGQHFLIDAKVLRRVVSAAELIPTDTVVEVGPGPGILTRELVKRAGRVIAIELDTKLASLLSQTLAAFSNLTIINADVLQIDPATLITDPRGQKVPYKVVANLPYYITSPVLRHFLESSSKPRCIVVMVQREVGENIVATPGEMSLLSVSVQFYGKPVIVDYVPAQSFYPRPKVDSAVVRIDVYERPVVEVRDIDGFFRVVRAGFSAPRKQLHNSLAHGLQLPPQAAMEQLRSAEINPRRRAETLTLEEWARLYQVLEEHWLEERQC